MKGLNLSKIKKAHFVGIGGIGVSAIARMMLAEGKIVSGSDSSNSLITKELEKLGAKIFQDTAPTMSPRMLIWLSILRRLTLKIRN